MSWYKFRNGILVQETEVAGATSKEWTLLGLHNFIMSAERSRETGQRPLVKLGFLNYKGERTIIKPEEVAFRLSRTDFGWGRYFGGRPGKLMGYSLEDEKILIVCSLKKVGAKTYTWQVDADTIDITYDELHDFYYQVKELFGSLLLKKADYPALFV
ncbi:hypothetical protein IJI55_00050 [Candidatus Saccharibacteria bacterium]|nr:hypothetical protein [Candidatus Saccharibacteria bacterium]